MQRRTVEKLEARFVSYVTITAFSKLEKEPHKIHHWKVDWPEPDKPQSTLLIPMFWLFVCFVLFCFVLFICLFVCLGVGGFNARGVGHRKHLKRTLQRTVCKPPSPPSPYNSFCSLNKCRAYKEDLTISHLHLYCFTFSRVTPKNDFSGIVGFINWPIRLAGHVVWNG